MTAIETARQVEGLRVAAARLGGPGGSVEAVTLPVYDDSAPAGLLEVPGVVARPMAAQLLVAATVWATAGTPSAASTSRLRSTACRTT